jgi:hypothetical protein
MFHMRNVKTKLSCSLNVRSPIFTSLTTEKSDLVSNYYYRSRFDHKTFYARLRNHTNFDIISNAKEEKGYPIPEGLQPVGYLPQHEYDLFLVKFRFVGSTSYLIFKVNFRPVRKLCSELGNQWSHQLPMQVFAGGMYSPAYFWPCPHCCVSEFRLSCPIIASLCSRNITRHADHVLVPTSGVASCLRPINMGPLAALDLPMSMQWMWPLPSKKSLRLYRRQLVRQSNPSRFRLCHMPFSILTFCANSVSPPKWSTMQLRNDCWITLR